jgi:hypothetical protein
MKARFRGGPLDGQEIEIDHPPLELTESRDGREVRYVLGHVDKRDVYHYYVPAEFPTRPK